MKKITKDMTLGDVVNQFPEAVPVFFKYGLHCIGCHVSAFETVEQGGMAHGMDEKTIKKMIEELNAAVEKK